MTFTRMQNLCFHCLQGLPILSLMILLVIDRGLSPLFFGLDLHLTFSALYYWLIYRPDLISPLTIMFLGLLRGSMIGEPLGFSAIILLTAYGLGIKQRGYLSGKPFLMIWGGFILFILFLQIFEWGGSMFLSHAFINFPPLIFQIILVILLYPLLTQCYFKVQKWVPGKS